MEKGNNNKSLYVIIFILLIGILSLGGYIVYDKVLNTNNDSDSNVQNNITNSSTESYNEAQLLALGLSMLKFANGASGYFSATQNNDGKHLINNYEQVAILFTDDYIKNAQDDMGKYHICWPTNEGTNYYINTNCGFGGPQSYTFKSMKIANYSDTTIDYTITYDEYSLDIKQHKDVQHNFQLVLEDNMWKINDYFNIY